MVLAQEGRGHQPLTGGYTIAWSAWTWLHWGAPTPPCWHRLLREKWPHCCFSQVQSTMANIGRSDILGTFSNGHKPTGDTFYESGSLTIPNLLT